MKYVPLILVLINLLALSTKADTMLLSTSSRDYNINNIYSNVDTFIIEIEINQPLEVGLYSNPEIVNMTYEVSGTLVPGTPSGFPSFSLRRNISGTEFYDQGSSLSFEISESADLSNGVQANELIDNGFILTLNAREIGSGRFHPALLELYSNGTGRIQNSNNIPDLDPLLEVNFGDEYITDLLFEPSEVTLISNVVEAESDNERYFGGGGSLWMFLIIFGAFFIIRCNNIKFNL